MAATKQAKKQAEPLDALAQADPLRIIALMLWQDRTRNPDMYRQLTERDMTGLDDCTRYLKVQPQVKIYRPAGLPAQEAIAAVGRRPAIPARPATPPKPYVIVTLVDQKGDTIKPIENNQGDYDIAQDAALVRKARDQAADLAQALLHQGRSGEYSLSTMQDAANALLILSRVT